MADKAQRGTATPDQGLVDMELVLSRVLQFGVTLAALIVACGLILLLTTGHSGYTPHGYPAYISAVASGLVQGKPYAWIATGLLVLLFTPVLRVAVSLVAFVVERDHIYVLVTVFVLTVLVSSFLLGSAGW